MIAEADRLAAALEPHALGLSIIPVHAPGMGADAEMIPEGQRNDTLFREARSRRAGGASPEAMRAALLAENAVRCVPPLDEAEMLAIADHAVTEAHRPDFAEPMTEAEAQGYAATRQAKRRIIPQAAETVKAVAGESLMPLAHGAGR